MPADTHRVNALISLASRYMGRDWGKFIEYSEEILCLSKELNFAKGLVSGYNK